MTTRTFALPVILSGYSADNMFDKICHKLLPRLGEGRDGETTDPSGFTLRITTILSS